MTKNKNKQGNIALILNTRITQVIQGVNMYSNSKVAKAIRLAMVFGAASVVSAPAAFAAGAPEAAEEVERIEVTGSRIKRTDVEGASPVQVISVEEFSQQGRLSIADALQNVTSNSFGSFMPSSGSSAQSQSTVSLLGAGSDRTLILLDGKRLAGSPSLGGSSVNLSSIPMAAVERIEILKDGASAVYGSDAIAGVINIILKKDFEGAAFDIQIGRPDEEGGDSKSMSLVLGMNSEKGNMTFVYDHQERGAIFDGDRDYTKASMEDLNGDGLISIYDETVGISYYGATIVNPTTGQLEASPKCDELASTVPGFVGSLDQGSALGGIGGGQVCGYGYANVSANSASTKRDSIMTSATYEINDDLELFARAMFSRNDSFGRFAPPAAGWDDIPANSEHNPYDETTDGFFRWYQIGTRDGEVTDYQQDYMLGLRGMINDNFDWEIAYHKAKLDYRSVGRSYLSYAGLYANLFLGEPLGSDDGIAAMKATTYTENLNEFDHIFGGVGFEMGELPGGMISHYFGGEYFEQSYDSKYDAQSEGGWIGGSAGNSASGERDTTAFFYEVSLPVTEDLVVSAAYRRDDYSDFGTKGTPSVKAEYRPMEDLLIRASYSKGFRAPSLSELLAATSFSATRAVDYVACDMQNIPADECKSRQFDNLIESNDQLDPEESTYINAGIVYAGIENFSVSLDYFNLEVENVISDITVQSLINAELGGQLDDMMARYPGVSLVRNPATGAITEDVITRSENGAIMTRQGLDLSLSYLLSTEVGDFRMASNTTYMIEVGEDVFFGGPEQDMAGGPGTPDWRSQFTLGYNYADFSATWSVDAIASTSEDEVLDVADGNPANFTQAFSNHNGTYVVHNLNMSYDFGQYGTVVIGARNLFEKGVMKDDEGFYNNDTLYFAGHLGRELYTGYKVKF